MAQEPTETPANTGVFPSSQLLTPELLCWWKQAASLFNTELEIVALEGERVARSMVRLLLYSLLAGLLVLTLWFATLTQLLLFIQAASFTLAQALGLVMVANLAAVWWLIRRCRHHSKYLRFPATRHSLKLLLTAGTGG